MVAMKANGGLRLPVMDNRCVVKKSFAAAGFQSAVAHADAGEHGAPPQQFSVR